MDGCWFAFSSVYSHKAHNISVASVAGRIIDCLIMQSKVKAQILYCGEKLARGYQVYTTVPSKCLVWQLQYLIHMLNMWDTIGKNEWCKKFIEKF